MNRILVLNIPAQFVQIPLSANVSSFKGSPITKPDYLEQERILQPFYVFRGKPISRLPSWKNGPKFKYSFDSEENYECLMCHKIFSISGWIREYPIGAYDSEEIYVEPNDDEIEYDE